MWFTNLDVILKEERYNIASFPGWIQWFRLKGFEENIWSQDPRDIAFVWLRPWGKFKTQHCRKQLAAKACMVWGSVLYLELRFEIPLYCCSCWTKLVNSIISIIIENHEGIVGIHLSTSCFSFAIRSSEQILLRPLDLSKNESTETRLRLV